MKRTVLITCFLTLCFTPLAFVLAQSGTGNTEGNFTFIVDFPRPAGSGIGTGEEITAEDFVNILYALSISIAGLLAVIKIIYAGVKYMLTDVAPQKGDAKKEIWGAILGLVIVLSAVFFLETINPQLGTLNIFTNTATIGANNTTGAVTTPNGAATPNNTNQLPANAVSDTFGVQCAGAGMTPVRVCTTAQGGSGSTTASNQTCSMDCRAAGAAATGPANNQQQ